MLDPVLHWTLALCLALLWSSSAWHKHQAPAQFAAALASYQLLPPSLFTPVSRCLPLFEIALAAGLLAPFFRHMAATPGALLLCGYALAMAINLLRGRGDIDCGCNPGHEQHISWLLVIRNLLLAGASLALLLPVAERAMEPTDMLLVVLGVTVCCGTYVFTLSILLDRDSNDHTVD